MDAQISESVPREGPRAAQEGHGLLGPPHRWCDRRCEQCRLRPNCPVALEALPESTPPLGADEHELRRAAIDHAMSVLCALEEAADEGRIEPAVTPPIIADAFAVAARTAPLVGADPGQAAGAVLVVEHLLHRIDGAIAEIEGALGAEALGLRKRRRWELSRRLQPLRSAVVPRQRASLIALIARGRAPSPFCRTS